LFFVFFVFFVFFCFALLSAIGVDLHVEAQPMHFSLFSGFFFHPLISLFYRVSMQMDQKLVNGLLPHFGFMMGSNSVSARFNSFVNVALALEQAQVKFVDTWPERLTQDFKDSLQLFLAPPCKTLFDYMTRCKALIAHLTEHLTANLAEYMMEDFMMQDFMKFYNKVRANMLRNCEKMWDGSIASGNQHGTLEDFLRSDPNTQQRSVMEMMCDYVDAAQQMDGPIWSEIIEGQRLEEVFQFCEANKVASWSDCLRRLGYSDHAVCTLRVIAAMAKWHCNIALISCCGTNELFRHRVRFMKYLATHPEEEKLWSVRVTSHDETIEVEAMNPTDLDETFEVETMNPTDLDETTEVMDGEVNTIICHHEEDASESEFMDHDAKKRKTVHE
jgi:hypothetical protein